MHAVKSTCQVAIETARDIISDVGEKAAKCAGSLIALSRCGVTNSERNCRRLFVNKLGLALPIPISWLEAKDDSVEVPLLLLRDWAQYIVDSNSLHVLLRPDPPREEAILASFWSKFKATQPSHPIFEIAERNQVQLHTVPCVMHGDEGRGRKRSAFMVLSFHSLLGRGLRPSEEKKHAQSAPRRYVKMLPTYIGHTYTNRFVFAALRTGQHDYVWKKLMEAAAAECLFMCTNGVFEKKTNKQYWIMVLHIIGDWPFLHKSGNLARSFNNCQKKKNVKAEPVGNCHWRKAGQTSWGFEQIHTRRPTWRTTMNDDDCVFVEPTPFQCLPHPPNQLARLWAFDFFHCWHLGLGKNYLGSVLALLSELETGGNVDTRFEQLSAK